VLDFGCASGRVIRWLDKTAMQCEVWGVDIDGGCIKWCQQNLSPPFHFATITKDPHLPYEDGYFKFIYALSVFTHIDDLAEAWLLELRRVTAPGGRLYITVHDEHTIDLIMKDPMKYWWISETLISFKNKTKISKGDYTMFSVNPGSHQCNVFYDIDFLCQHWGKMLNVLSVTSEAYGYQTAILLEKSGSDDQKVHEHSPRPTYTRA